MTQSEPPQEPKLHSDNEHESMRLSEENRRLRELIRQRLEEFDFTLQTAERSAGVAVVITEAGFGSDLPNLPQSPTWQTDPALVLTRRSAKLNKHAGQWALPGGRVDQDETVQQTAIRESAEEIHLNLSVKDCLGRLDDYVSRSGFVMSPWVFWPENTRSMHANPDEVASIHRIPFTEFLRDDAPMLDYNELDEEERQSTQNNPVLRMPLGEHWIAAPTAAILYQFREVCLLGNKTRVAHFEQPKFTWR